MKFILIITLLSLQLASFGAVTQIGVLDMEEIYTEYYKTKAQSALFNKQKQVYKAYSTSLKRTLDDYKARFKVLLTASQNISLKISVRSTNKKQAGTLAKKIRLKEEEFLQYNRSKYEELKQKSEIMRETIIVEIQEVVRELSKTNGFDLVIDISSKGVSGIQSVLYYNDSLDLTKAVQQILNSK